MSRSGRVYSAAQKANLLVEKILIVDDNSDTRELLAKLLELESFTVVTAEDGLMGLKMASDELPDLIVTDITMPNLNGIDMIRLLRKKLEFKQMPIVTITAYGRSTVDKAIEAGADLALTKPVEFDALINDINHLLHRVPGQGV
jgi:DNA-binding response OmpR family regulator